jgi:hypothetical protein
MRDAVEAKAPSGRGIVLRNKENGSGNGADESYASPTPRQLQLIASADLIFSRPADLADTAYLAREMAPASLPHKDPGNVPGWVRRNGNSSLYIQPGFNPETGKNYGYPSRSSNASRFHFGIARSTSAATAPRWKASPGQVMAERRACWSAYA